MAQYLPAARGSAFGFEVRSKLAFRHLRNGDGDPLEIEANDISERPGREDKLLVEWKQPEHAYSARLYFNGSRYLFFVAGIGWFRVDPAAGQITVPDCKDVARVEEKLWGIPAMLCFIARGDHALHADAVETNGSAILISGPQRLGRSALAATFAGAGHRVLSQNLSCLRVGQNIGLVPGPALLKVDKRSVPALDISSGNGTWNDEKSHYSLDATRRGTSKPVPIRSIILLREGAGESLDPLIPAQAISDLWSSSFRLPTEDDRGRCFQGVADIATNVPVWTLTCEGNPQDLSDLVERITSTSLEYV